MTTSFFVSTSTIPMIRIMLMMFIFDGRPLANIATIHKIMIMIMIVNQI